MQRILNQETATSYTVLFDDPTDSSRMILYSQLCGKPYQDLPLDDRPCRLRCTIVLKKGPATELIQKERSVAFMHFIVKNLAMKIRPECWPFFDYSLSGDKKLYGEDKNPQVLVCLPSKRIVHAGDTQKVPPETRTISCASDDELSSALDKNVETRFDRREFNPVGNTGTPPNFAKYKRITPKK